MQSNMIGTLGEKLQREYLGNNLKVPSVHQKGSGNYTNA